MKRGFVRCFWGTPSRAYKRNSKVVNIDLEFIKYNIFDQPFTTYVFGESNLKLLNDHGITNCKLLSQDVSLWNWKDIKSKNIDQYGHKLRALQAASDDFDEFVFLDWDCMLAKPISDNFWDVLNQKAAIQCHLRSYRMKEKYIKRKGATWREENVNLRPCASFIYIRDKEIAEKIYNKWNENKSKSDETALAMITDEMMGGWQGVNKYWEMFEPSSFTLFKSDVKRQCFSKELLKQKDLMFMHCNKHIIGHFLRMAKELEMTQENKNIYISQKLNEMFCSFVKKTTGAK